MPGDVGFLTVEQGSSYGFDEAFSEIARLDSAEAFFAVCRRMRLEGAKRIEIAAGK